MAIVNSPGSTVGAGSPVLGTVSSVAAFAGPVGIVISAITGTLAALGIHIRGATQHLSYEEVAPQANAFNGNMTALLEKYYSPSELALAAAKVPPYFIGAMRGLWGFSGLNEVIATDITSNFQINDALSRQFFLFIIWIGTNVDKEIFQTTVNEYVPNLFRSIFVAAFRDAGLDTSLVEAAAPARSTGSPSNPPVVPGAVKEAKISPALAFILVGALIFGISSVKGKVA